MIFNVNKNVFLFSELRVLTWQEQFCSIWEERGNYEVIIALTVPSLLHYTQTYKSPSFVSQAQPGDKAIIRVGGEIQLFQFEWSQALVLALLSNCIV